MLGEYKRRHADTPMLVVETGNELKQSDNLEDPANRWILEAFNLLGSHAINITPADLRRLNRLAEKDLIPQEPQRQYVASVVELSSASRLPVKPYAIQRLSPDQGGDEIRIGILAVSLVTPGSEQVGKILDVETALKRYVPEVEAQSDLVILLARLPEAAVAQMAQKFPSIDVIINGSSTGEGRELPRVGHCVLVESAHQGIALGMLQVEWDSAGHITRSQNQVVPLPPMVPDSQALTALVEKAHRDIALLEEEEAKKSPPVTIPRIFAGAKACKNCHKKAYDVWVKSAHARAIESLKRTSDQFNKECLGCHVTGFWADRGFVNVVRTPQLVNVQCEACHGTALDHSRNPQMIHPGLGELQKMRRRVTKEFCLRCHTPEQSPRFNFEQYWSKIQH